MTLTFYVLLLSFEIILFSRLDKIFYKTYLTPFVVLSVPFLIVTLLAYCFGPLFGFFPLSDKVILIWIIYLFLFWTFGSLLIMSLFRRYIIVNEPFGIIRYKTLFKKLLIFISWLIIAFVLLKLLKTIHKFNGFKIWEDSFSFYFIKGIVGHLMVFLTLTLIYFCIIVTKNDKSIKVLIFLILVLLFIYQVKTWIFVPAFVVFFFLLLENRITIKIKSLALSSFMIFFVFLLFYFPSSGFNKNYFFDPYTYKFIINHVFFYLFSGVLGFSEHIRAGFKTNIEPAMVFRPFINIFNLITSSGTIKPIVSDLYYHINSNFKLTSNVHTFIGSLIIYSGFKVAGIYLILVSFSLYSLLLLNFINKNIWILIIYLFMLSGLGVGWFNLYFNNLSFIEIPAYCFILALLSEATLKRRPSK
jgi:hypothetical protein